MNECCTRDEARKQIEDRMLNGVRAYNLAYNTNSSSRTWFHALETLGHDTNRLNEKMYGVK